MKKIIALFLAFILIFGVTACKKADNKSESSSPSEIQHTAPVNKVKDVKISMDAFPENTDLRIEAIKGNDPKVIALKSAFENLAAVNAYEFTAKLDGLDIQPNGTVEAIFPFPAVYDSQKHDAAVYFVNENAEITKMNSKISDIGIRAILTHFSAYAVVLTYKEVDREPTASENSSTFSTTEEKPLPTFSDDEVKKAAEAIMSANELAYFWDYENGIYSNDYKALDPEKVFLLLYYYLDDKIFKAYTTFETTEEGYSYPIRLDIPLTVLNRYSKEVLGNEYDFTKIGKQTDEEDSCYYNSDKKTIVHQLLGGYGNEPDDAYYYKDYIFKGDNTVDCTLEFWEVDDKTFEKVKVLHTGVLTMKRLDSGIWQIIKFKK